jgi:uracil-DNA glycosylase
VQVLGYLNKNCQSYIMEVKINNEWKEVLQSEFDSQYFVELTDKVKEEYKASIVFPNPANIFRAFDLVPLSQVKVVILGQDPYHTPGVADGLSFSSYSQNKVPPSLQNIYKEIEFEMGYDKHPYKYNPDLTRWANQGVLLINNTLTVRQGEPNSHQSYGWTKFTDQVIKTISDNRQGIVFILWGAFAKGKKSLIDANKHLILESAHPSPFSAHNGFFGNEHFTQANDYLKKQNSKVIEW